MLLVIDASQDVHILEILAANSALRGTDPFSCGVRKPEDEILQHEMPIKYSINNGQKLEFFVPGRNQNMRWVGYSVRR